MTHNTSSPVAVLAIAFFAVTGLFAASPIGNLVDCNDSFWQVACADATPGDPANSAAPEAQSANLLPATSEDDGEGPVVIEETRRIDNEAVCATLENGYLFCHS